MPDLSIETAQGLVAGSPAEVSDLRGELAEEHAEHPQRAQLADLALQEIESGLEKLRSLGHQFHLTHGALAAPESFPKMLYRTASGAESQLTVHSEAEEADAKEQGWMEHPSLQAPADEPPTAVEQEPSAEQASQIVTDPTQQSFS